MLGDTVPTGPRVTPPVATATTFFTSQLVFSPPKLSSVQIFSVVDTDHAEALNARAANYETMLRTIRTRRGPNRTFQPPSVAMANARSGVSTVRSYRTSITEDLHRTLSRLGSTLALDRIRRYSVENSVNATSAPAVAGLDVGGRYFGQRRVSLTRVVGRGSYRLKRFARTLTQPLSPLSSTALVHSTLVLAALALQIVYSPFAASFLAQSPDSTTRDSMVIPNIVLEFVWIFDILLRFNTSIIVVSTPPNQGRTLITARSELARRYLRGAFAVDMLGALPLESSWRLICSSPHPPCGYTMWET